MLTVCLVGPGYLYRSVIPPVSCPLVCRLWIICQVWERSHCPPCTKSSPTKKYDDVIACNAKSKCFGTQLQWWPEPIIQVNLPIVLFQTSLKMSQLLFKKLPIIPILFQWLSLSVFGSLLLPHLPHYASFWGLSLTCAWTAWGPSELVENGRTSWSTAINVLLSLVPVPLELPPSAIAISPIDIHSQPFVLVATLTVVESRARA